MLKRVLSPLVSSSGTRLLQCNSKTARSYQLLKIRHFGISDKLMGMATKKLESGKEGQFIQMLEMMTKAPKWTLRPWRTTLETQLSSWNMYVPGVSQSKEIVEMKMFKELMDVMTEKELDNPELVTGLVKTRISMKSGRSIDEVGKLIHMYKQSKVIAEWLQLKKSKNEKIPTSQEEFIAMQENDPRVRAIAAKIMAPKKKKSY
mmetsp:Transcript_29935/g.28616  ORF Transcript_29935/g.28616 Transcript_29935/m.28616 type:complete len:204 (-) Transcript_29935:351-962(-)